MFIAKSMKPSFTLSTSQASQQWNGLGVLDLMRETPSAGGPWLMTDMRRGETIFEVNPGLRDKVRACKKSRENC